MPNNLSDPSTGAYPVTQSHIQAYPILEHFSRPDLYLLAQVVKELAKTFGPERPTFSGSNKPERGIPAQAQR